MPRHHLVPRDFTKPGPDEAWNIAPLCGSGTSGCHGAFHGSAYVADGLRHTPESVRGEIAQQLVKDTGRMTELAAFLDDPLLLRRFFERVLLVGLIEGGRWPDVHYYRVGSPIRKLPA